MNPLLHPKPQPDEQLEAITHAARRRLLLSLLDRPSQEGTPVEIAEWVDESDIAETRVDIYHTHLPELEDRGYVRWDRERCHVAPGPQFGEIEPLLTLLYEHRDELPDEWL